MNTLLIIITGLFSIIGLTLFVWSLFNTRRKFYSEYLLRNKK